ncbi:MAG: NUDIX domain-containing protein [Candidatus Berkelbacteria bacterium]|nr:NUDIX domain-containing protein [Candidatus Berkelbacteria bacterium]
MDKRFDYPSIVAVKIALKNGDKILLIREPETNDWMPGRLGLPGGKLMLNESLPQAIERKIKTEIGLEIEIKGIVRIVDILMPEKNVYHFVLLADYISGEINTSQTESSEIKWFEQKEIKNLSVDDFTEYYNSEIIKQVLAGNAEIIPMSAIKVQDNREKEVLDWMEKGKIN